MLIKEDINYHVPLGYQFKYWSAYQAEQEAAKCTTLFVVVLVLKATAAAATTTTKPKINYAAHRSFSSISNNNRIYDAAIAGAGIMGLSIAYQLKKSFPNLNVVICEQANGLGNGSWGGAQVFYEHIIASMKLCS